MGGAYNTPLRESDTGVRRHRRSRAQGSGTLWATGSGVSRRGLLARGCGFRYIQVVWWIWCRSIVCSGVVVEADGASHEWSAS